jgi:hypothetical protein
MPLSYIQQGERNILAGIQQLNNDIAQGFHNLGQRQLWLFGVLSQGRDLSPTPSSTLSPAPTTSAIASSRWRTKLSSGVSPAGVVPSAPVRMPDCWDLSKSFERNHSKASGSASSDAGAAEGVPPNMRISEFIASLLFSIDHRNAYCCSPIKNTLYPQ